MQELIIQNRRFCIEECQRPVAKDYPQNVRLNCLFLGGKLYGKIDAADASVLDFCRERKIPLVHVKQGYTRCSSLVIGDNAVITADKSIAKALKADGAEVLSIQPGHIRLEGFEYGFIGGAGFFDNGTTYFFGNIKKHPDYERIKVFCAEYNSKIEILNREEQLTDIGGVVIRTE
ncbi:MAG: hypothetical protein IIU42_01820 [Ruminococcus sp.]|nr:hypothetical protein [Ruminococcus sp.]